MIKSITLLLIFLITAPIANSQPAPNKQRLAAEVKSEFLHAWNGYKKYAWGHDDLRPLTKSFHDWYAQPLLMTPVDALDTMILMGLKDEADATRKYILDNLSFDKDIDVQNFEITIRLLGGLLSSYQLTGDRRLLALAEDLGNRLLPVFESPNGSALQVRQSQDRQSPRRRNQPGGNRDLADRVWNSQQANRQTNIL